MPQFEKRSGGALRRSRAKVWNKSGAYPLWAGWDILAFDVPPENNNTNRWRREAAEARAAAMNVTDPAAHRVLCQIAAAYGRLAEHAARRASLQRTRREGDQVRTESVYLGPADTPAPSTGPKREPLRAGKFVVPVGGGRVSTPRRLSGAPEPIQQKPPRVPNVGPRTREPLRAGEFVIPVAGTGAGRPAGQKLDRNPDAKLDQVLARRYAPWPWDAIEHLATHARPDLWHAGALALFSGQRLSDVLKVMWNDISEGLISVRQGKTGKSLRIPVHRRLASILAGVPRASVYVLTNTRGRPWTVDGFKGSWGDELNRPIMRELRERRLVFHGLRKSAVVTLLEAGATDAKNAPRFVQGLAEIERGEIASDDEVRAVYKRIGV